jgi:hypothetical protein
MEHILITWAVTQFNTERIVAASLDKPPSMVLVDQKGQFEPTGVALHHIVFDNKEACEKTRLVVEELPLKEFGKKDDLYFPIVTACVPKG